MKYILHFCRNKKCNNGWIDKDINNNMSPPKWKYCRECCEKLGIDFDSQKYEDTLTKEEKEKRKKKAEQISNLRRKNMGDFES